MIRKIVAFIWNGNNVKGRSPTHLLIECMHLEFRFDKVWTLLDYFVVMNIPLVIGRMGIFDLKM